MIGAIIGAIADGGKGAAIRAEAGGRCRSRGDLFKAAASALSIGCPPAYPSVVTSNPANGGHPKTGQ